MSCLQLSLFQLIFNVLGKLQIFSYQFVFSVRSASSLKLVASLAFLCEMLFLLTIEIPLSTSFLLPRQKLLRCSGLT